MNDTQALTPRPQLQPPTQPVRSAVVARVNEHSIAAEATNPDLQGLVQGLQALNPELQKYVTASHVEARDETFKKADAQAFKQEHPRDALTGAPVAVPSDVPPAFGELYRERFKHTASQRAALQVAGDVTAQYESQKDLPDFNVETFLADQRRTALAGLQDTSQVAIMGAHLDEVAQRIKAADTSKLVARHETERKQTMAEIANNGMSLDQSPEELAGKAHWIIDQGATIQVHPETATKAILQRVASMSQQAGGKPELFDVFDAPNADGRTLRMLAPDLSETIDAHKHQAATMRDQRLHEATEGDRYSTRVKLDRMVDESPEQITEGFVRDYVGKNSLSAEQAASYVNQARDRLAKKALINEARAAYQTGGLWRYSGEVQNKVLEENLGPALTNIQRVTATGSTASPADIQTAVQMLSEQVIQGHSSARASEPVAPLKQFIGTSVTSMPDAKGPSPGFLASAALYRALSGAPQYRDLYFKGAPDDVLRAYNSQAYEFGRDPNTAYQNAYLANSPEAKANAAKKLNDPTFLKDVEETAIKAVSGSTWLRLWGGALGMNGRPQNDFQVGDWITQQARELKRSSPYLSDDDVKAKVESMARDNWVMDATSRHAVRVPSGQGSERTGDAFTDLTNTIVDTQKKKGAFPSGSSVRYFPVGDTGMYQVKVVNGTMEKTVDTVAIQDVTRRYDIKTNLQPEEAKQLRQLITDVRSGKPLGMIDPVLLRKGQTSGFISSTDMGLIDVQQHKATMDKMLGGPQVDLGKPTGNNTLEVSRGSVRVDPKLTARTALGLAFGDDSGSVPSADHVKLAASLATVREGVVLSAYSDPARGAGLNIGAGYNLKGNATTTAADLQAVGVPPNRIEDIKAGKAALTPEQAKWLTQLTMRRVDEQVKKVAEGVKPGLWASLSAPQKAVMLDVAYQTGDASQYRKAWAALAKGDTQAFRSELRTYYTNQQGQRTEDTRALDLRASLLQGLPAWKARLSVASQ